VGEDLEAEQKRILAMLESPPEGVLPPSIIVYSGGGYQAFWLLNEPYFPINGDLSAADQAARYNQQLEVLLGGDATHDVSRIMRIPHTMNVPGEKKLKKGRSAVEARVVRFNSTAIYDLSQFLQAPELQTAAGAKVTDIEISANVARVDDLAALFKQYKLNPRLQVVIEEGWDEEDTTLERSTWSRSEWLFLAVGDLLRAGVPDETIYSIITDPDYKISKSVLEKHARADSYAKRQIRNAKLKNSDPIMARFNDKHAVIMRDAGKCVIITEEYDSVMQRLHLEKQLPIHFFNAYANEKMQTTVQTPDGKAKHVTVPAAKHWFEHPQRRQYNRIVFAPGRVLPDCYNLWRGFAYEAIPGDGHEEFLRHIRENLCCGNETYYNFVLGWMASAVQFPGRPGETAIVLRGDEGVGKSFFAENFGALFGRHFMKVSQSSHLVGNFNGHLQDTVLLFADEGIYAGDRQHANVLKDLITGKTLTVERKHENTLTTPNCLHIVMASNSQWVVPAGPNARRYFVLDVASNKICNGPYFKAIQEQLDNGGFKSLLYFLLNYDLAAVDVRTAPITAALQEQKVLSMEVHESWWYSRLQEGATVSCEQGWRTEVPVKALYTDYLEFSQQQRVFRPLSPTAFGIFLRRCLGDKVEMRQRRQNKVREWCYVIPGLAECRALWDSKLLGHNKWDTPSEQEYEEPQQDTPF